MSVQTFSPTTYYHEHLLPASNVELSHRRYKELKVEEFYGCILVMRGKLTVLQWAPIDPVSNS